KNMININIEMEKESTEAKTVKLFNVTPLRTSVIPSYITLDTSSIIDLFIKKDVKKYKDNIEKYKDEIWSKFFDTEMRCFKKKGYKFSGMIKTDGIGCTIIFEKNNVQSENVNVKNDKNMDTSD